MKQLIFILFISIQCVWAQTAKPVKLKKIIFHTTACFGTCPVYHLEVKCNRQVRLYAERVFKDNLNRQFGVDSARMGYFTGKITKEDFNNLVSELQNAGIDTLTFNGPNCCDGSVSTIIVYYNGKRKYLEAMFPPAEANSLISALRGICEIPNLKRSAAKFEIEGTKE